MPKFHDARFGVEMHEFLALKRNLPHISKI